MRGSRLFAMRSLRLWGETHLVDLVFPVLVECVCSWNASLCTKGVYTPASRRSGDPGTTVGPGLKQLLGHREKGIQAVSAPLDMSRLAHNEKEPSEMAKVYFFGASLNSPHVRRRCISQMVLQPSGDVQKPPKAPLQLTPTLREAEICINRVAAKGLAGRGGRGSTGAPITGPRFVWILMFCLRIRRLPPLDALDRRQSTSPKASRRAPRWLSLELCHGKSARSSKRPKTPSLGVEEKGRRPRADVAAAHPDS